MADMIANMNWPGQKGEDRLQQLNRSDLSGLDDHDDISAAVDDMHVIDFLSYRLSMLCRVLDRDVDMRNVQEYKIGLTEVRLLSYLCANSPTTVRAIAGNMHLDKAQVSRAAAALKEMGLVSRKSDPDDKRSATFDVTEAGRTYYDQRLEIARRGQKELLSQLDADEYRVVSGVIDKMFAYAVDKTAKDKKC